MFPELVNPSAAAAAAAAAAAQRCEITIIYCSAQRWRQWSAYDFCPAASWLGHKFAQRWQ